MHKYYIPEISIKNIRNTLNIIDYLKNKYSHTTNINTLILTTDGFYKLEKDVITKYIICNNVYHISTYFLNILCNYHR